jgi:hypothetical protein
MTALHLSQNITNDDYSAHSAAGEILCKSYVSPTPFKKTIPSDTVLINRVTLVTHRVTHATRNIKTAGASFSRIDDTYDTCFSIDYRGGGGGGGGWEGSEERGGGKREGKEREERGGLRCN